MKTKTVRQVVMCGLGVVMMGALLVAGWAHADGAKFSHRERVVLAMDNSPELVVDALEKVLSQEQIDAFESLLLPKPTDTEKRAALDSAKAALLRAGFAQDDPVVSAVAARADAIKVDEAPAAGPDVKE